MSLLANSIVGRIAETSKGSRGRKRRRLEMETPITDIERQFDTEGDLAVIPEYFTDDLAAADDYWSAAMMPSLPMNGLITVRSNNSLPSTQNIEFGDFVIGDVFSNSMRYNSSLSSLVSLESFLDTVTTREQHLDFPDATAARQWLSTECTTAYFRVIFEKKDVGHPDEFRIMIHWTAEGRSVLAKSNESLATIIDQEMSGTRRAHKKYLFRIRFSREVDSVDDAVQKTQERIENWKELQAVCNFLQGFMMLPDDERAAALQAIDEVIINALGAPKENGFRIRSYNIMLALFQHADHVQSAHGAAILVGFSAGSRQGGGTGDDGNAGNEYSDSPPDDANDNPGSGDGSIDAPSDAHSAERAGGEAGGGSDDDDDRPHPEEGEIKKSSYESNSTSVEYTESSDEDGEQSERDIAAMRRGLAEVLEPLRTLLQGMARQWRETIMREIHAFFMAPVKPAVVEVVAYEAIVEERIKAASTDLVRAGRGMVTMLPQVMLECRRLGEEVRRIYQQHKTAHASTVLLAAEQPLYMFR